MSTFTARTSAPSTSDKYWIHSSKGGLNECILISGNSCIPNCVGYAWGRAYELLGSRPKLSRMNAEDWFGYADGYPRSQIPSLGAIICWSKGKVGYEADGAGHVAVVEEIKPNGDVVTSNSGYNTTRFWMQTFTKASNYSMGSGYTFQGFIHILHNSLNTTTPDTPASNTSTPNPTTRTATDPATSLDKSLSGAYTVTATDGLYIRSRPGVIKTETVMALLPYNTRVNNYGYYTLVDGVKWLYVQVTYNGVKYTGFCSSQYLKK